MYLKSFDGDPVKADVLELFYSTVSDDNCRSLQRQLSYSEIT